MRLKYLLLVLIFCILQSEGKPQVSISLNTGLVLSKGREGSAKHPDWGRGGGKSYQFESSSFKPGALIGIGLKSSKTRKVFPSLSFNVLWLQNEYNYTGTITNPDITWSLTGKVISKSIYFNTQLALNINILDPSKTKLYLILGLSPSIKLQTKLSGDVISEKNSYPGIITIDTLRNEQIYWTSKAVFISGLAGIGTNIKVFNIPMDIQLAFVPSFTDLYSLPNLQTSSIYLMINFQLFRKMRGLEKEPE